MSAVPGLWMRADPVDLRWLRWSITACALLTLANIFRSYDAGVWIASFANTGFGVLLCLYFIHILLRRLQCGLLDFLIIVAVLFNIEGLLLTSPGFVAFGWAWSSCLGAIAAAWVLAGAVNALTACRILEMDGSGERVGMLLAYLAGAAAPALILVGILLTLSDPHGLFRGVTALHALVGARLSAWGMPLLIAGLVAAIVRIWLGIKVRRIAKAIRKLAAA